MSLIAQNIVSDLEARILDTVTTFIKNLYLTAQLGQGISWNYDGTAIVFCQNEHLLVKIIERIYNQTKVSSFVRQLNFYGFSKVMVMNPLTKKREAVTPPTFSHTYFRRGRVDLLIHVLRKTNGKGINSFQSVNDIATLQAARYGNNLTVANPTAMDETMMDNPHNLSSFRESTNNNLGRMSSLPIIPLTTTTTASVRNNSSNFFHSNNNHFYRSNTSNQNNASSMPIEPVSDMIIDELITDNNGNGNRNYSKYSSKKSVFHNHFRNNTLSTTVNNNNNHNHHHPNQHQPIIINSGTNNDHLSFFTNNPANNNQNHQQFINTLQNEIRYLTLERDILRTVITNNTVHHNNNQNSQTLITTNSTNTSTTTLATMDNILSNVPSSLSSPLFSLAGIHPTTKDNNTTVPMDIEQHLPSSTSTNTFMAHPNTPSTIPYTTLSSSAPDTIDTSITSATTTITTDGFHLSNSILNPNNATLFHHSFPANNTIILNNMSPCTVITSTSYSGMIPPNLGELVFPSLFLTPSENGILNDETSCHEENNVHDRTTFP